MYKQVIVVRKDLKIGKGKLAVHVAHASLEAYELVNKKVKEKWKKEGAKKVVLKVKNLEKLLEVYEKAKRENLPVVLIRDAGKTQLKEGVITCIAIGPAEETKIDKITGKLKLL